MCSLDDISLGERREVIKWHREMLSKTILKFAIYFKFSHIFMTRPFKIVSCFNYDSYTSVSLFTDLIGKVMYVFGAQNWLILI